MRLVETTILVSVSKCYRFSCPISEVRIISEKQAHRNTRFSDTSSAECSKTTTEACQERLFCKYYPIEIWRPQWPDWCDKYVHNILQKVPEDGGCSGQCGQTRLNCEPEHRKSAWVVGVRYLCQPTPITSWLPPTLPTSCCGSGPCCQLHFALCWWRANNKPHKRPALRPPTHTYMHKYTQPHTR